MKTKAQIIARIKEIEKEMNENDGELTTLQYHEFLGKLRALNWVMNKD